MTLAVADWMFWWVYGIAIGAIVLGWSIGFAVGSWFATRRPDDEEETPDVLTMDMYITQRREPSGAQVWPCAETKLHLLDESDCDCPCFPKIMWIDEDTGEPFENGPLVLHNRLRGESDGPGENAGSEGRDE